MKYILFTITALLLFSLNTRAQINVGSEIKAKGLGTDDFEPGVLKDLKKTKTYFIYSQRDLENLEDWKKVMNRAWKFTKFDFMSLEEFAKVKNHTGNSYLLRDFDIEVTTKGGTIMSSEYFGYLTLCTFNKEDKATNYCRIELFPSGETIRNAGELLVENKEDMYSFLYSKANFHNWYPGLLMSALSQVSAALLNDNPINFYKQVDDQPELSELKNTKLYIPKYAFVYKLGLRRKDYVDAPSLIEKYGFEAEVMEAKKLSKLILESNENIYTLLYIQSMTDKFVTIWNASDARLLYKDYQAVKLSMKKKDFKKITKAIEEA